MCTERRTGCLSKAYNVDNQNILFVLLRIFIYQVGTSELRVRF